MTKTIDPGQVPGATRGYREFWLNAATAELRNLFAEIGEVVPPIRVSVGWPGGRSSKRTTIGQCWNSQSASDGICQIFISPRLHEPMKILETLLHELVHAIDDCQNGHKGRFAKLAKQMGLEGKMTATHAGPGLRMRLEPIVEKLGEFPHAAINTADGLSGEPKQSTRMIKLTADHCGYIVRTTRKWLTEGLPSCPHGEQMMESLHGVAGVAVAAVVLGNLMDVMPV